MEDLLCNWSQKQQKEMLSKLMTCYMWMMAPSFSQPNWNEEATQTIHDHFAKFGLQMHVGSTSAKSKSEAMLFPSSLTQAKSQKTLPKNFDLNNGNIHVQFTDKFNYLGWIITPCLTENAEIDARIKRAKWQMGQHPSMGVQILEPLQSEPNQTMCFPSLHNPPNLEYMDRWSHQMSNNKWAGEKLVW